jgi:8-oxo-dGTP diphosphatase
VAPLTIPADDGDVDADGVDRHGVVRAAGGVLVRPGGGPGGTADVAVLVAHRPKYDDWSLPKGKRDPGETDEEAALREVAEEVGVRARLGRERPSTTYHDREGRPKVVRYWEMTVVEGEAGAGDGVDEVRWLPVDQARQLLTHDRDRDVLDAL